MWGVGRAQAAWPALRCGGRQPPASCQPAQNRHELRPRPPLGLPVRPRLRRHSRATVAVVVLHIRDHAALGLRVAGAAYCDHMCEIVGEVPGMPHRRSHRCRRAQGARAGQRWSVLSCMQESAPLSALLAGRWRGRIGDAAGEAMTGCLASGITNAAGPALTTPPVPLNRRARPPKHRPSPGFGFTSLP